MRTKILHTCDSGKLARRIVDVLILEGINILHLLCPLDLDVTVRFSVLDAKGKCLTDLSGLEDFLICSRACPDSGL